VLEDANVKLASVATDVLGKSGRAMLEDIIAGEDDPEHLALGHLRVKMPQLRLALEGKKDPYHVQKNQSNCDDLGGNDFDGIHSDGPKRYSVRRLEQLGQQGNARAD
jgi:hypothetical protein